MVSNYFVRAYYVSVAVPPSYTEYHKIFASTLWRLGRYLSPFLHIWNLTSSVFIKEVKLLAQVVKSGIGACSINLTPKPSQTNNENVRRVCVFSCIKAFKFQENKSLTLTKIIFTIAFPPLQQVIEMSSNRELSFSFSTVPQHLNSASQTYLGYCELVYIMVSLKRIF